MKHRNVFWGFCLALIVLVSCTGPQTQSITQTPVLTAVSEKTATSTIEPVATPSDTATPSLQVHQSEIEVVTNDAVSGDGGNNWGGHQTRIVHTEGGIFTAYTVDGGGQFTRDWKLAQRQTDGTWIVIAEGHAGQQPVNLLASPDGTLHVIGWPSGVATMWSGKPGNGSITMTATKIPNVASGNYPYGSAGTDSNGNLCILSSTGGSEPIGWFNWACYQPEKEQWITQTNKLDFRFCYTYVFPSPDGKLSLVSTRDVVWSALGYKQPAGTFDYVFNAFRYWRTNDITSEPIQELSFAEEVPTDQYPDVFLDAQLDAYLDTKDQMHILYTVTGSSTGGVGKVRHRIVSSDGTTIFDEEVPREAGDFVRIFQDKEKRFYLLGSSGVLYPMDSEGMTPGKPIKLDLGRYQVEYSGFGLSVPRTGTPLSNTMDVVFPSSNGKAWLYFQLDFSNTTTNAGVLPTQLSNPQSATPTVNSFQAMLDNARVLFASDMNDPTLPGWDWWDDKHAVITTENGTLMFNKNQSDGAQIHSQYGLKENEACLALFRYTGDPDFVFEAVNGNWWDDTWRAWGMNEGTDGSMPGKHLQSFYSLGQRSNYTSLGLRDVPDRWYYLLLWVQNPTTFLVRAWEKDNPEVFVERQLKMTDSGNWTDRSWNCHLLINSGTLEMGSYKELRFSQTP